MPVSLSVGARQIPYKTIHFPAGELGVQIEQYDLAHKWSAIAVSPKENFLLTCHFKSSEDLIILSLLCDALRRISPTFQLSLFIPYFPYGRQDRVCTPGESLSVAVAAEFINALKFVRVGTVDAHSDVTTALVKNVLTRKQSEVILGWNDLRHRIRTCELLAPDAGSYKRVVDLEAHFGREAVIGKKIRELSTGKILHMSVADADLEGKEVFCPDDICDGGMTFMGLAKTCKDRGAKKFILYVTHGVFSRGLTHLFENGIDEVWTTNSYPFDDSIKLSADPAKFKVLELEGIK